MGFQVKIFEIKTPINDLVLKSDGWHLFQSIFLTTLFASIVLYKPIFNYHEIDAIRMIADFVILRGVFGFGFVLFYNKLLLK